MNAILYAAGRATRLGGHTRERHKILLEFGGKTLLERHLRTLAELRIRQLTVITGHRREQLQAAFPILETRYNVRIEEIFNPDFAEGSILSMHVSLPAVESSPAGVLLMDGDVLYDTHLLRRLLETPEPTALLVDLGYSQADDDPVLVPMRGGKPFDFIKKWRGAADAVGESVGFFKIGAADRPLLAAETRRRAEGGGRNDSYDDVLRALVREGRFAAVDATGLPWTEIDFPEDLELAERVIYPRLAS